MSKLDDDVLHYIKIAVIVFISAVAILVMLFLIFRPSAKIELSRHSVEYGETLSAIDLIEKVKGEDVSTADITKGTMTFDDLEISATELDTKKLGEQNIIYSFSDGSKDISETIEVVDTTKPEITLKTKKITLSLDEAKKMKSWKQYYQVQDNYHEFPTVLEELEEEELDYGSSTYVKIRAIDTSGNEADARIQLQIKEKEVKKKKEAQIEEKDPKQESSKQEPQQSTQEEPQEDSSNDAANEIPEEKIEIPAKDYLFSDGYDMTTAPQACQIDLSNSGRSGMCVPLQDDNGIYIGMRLTFE